MNFHKKFDFQHGDFEGMKILSRLNRIALLTVIAFALQYATLPVVYAKIISTKQEIAIGENVAKQIEERYELVDDPDLQARVDRIGKRIVAVSDRQDLPYTFKVLAIDEVNAMAAPGGFIYVFKGLVDLMPTDDELAGIIGHEIGHVVQRHSMAQLEKTLGMALLLGGVFGDRGVPLQAIALNAISAGYSRSDERRADKFGYEHSVKAGYNQYGMLMGLTKLYELNPTQKSNLFSDHPEAAKRIKLMQSYLAENNITPTVASAKAGETARVVDGAWSLPEFKTAMGETGPLYRAYLTAGRLHDIRKKADYSADRYILDGDGTNLTIYYEELSVVTLTPEDAAAAGVSLEQLTQTYLQSLKQWGNAG